MYQSSFWHIDVDVVFVVMSTGMLVHCVHLCSNLVWLSHPPHTPHTHTTPHHTLVNILAIHSECWLTTVYIYHAIPSLVNFCRPHFGMHVLVFVLNMSVCLHQIKFVQVCQFIILSATGIQQVTKMHVIALLLCPAISCTWLGARLIVTSYIILLSCWTTQNKLFQPRGGARGNVNFRL